MVQAKSLYISLRDDPDLSIPEGDTRESAAWNEMSQRVRQHKSNSKALAMASEVSEPSSIEKFADFIEKAPASQSDTNKIRDLLRDIQPPIASDRDTHYDGRQKAFDKVISKFMTDNKNVLGVAARRHLEKNLDEYFGEEAPFGRDFVEHLHDLEFGGEGEQQDFLKQLLQERPFTVEDSLHNPKDGNLRDMGYIASGQRAKSGKYKLTPEGAAHLLFSNKRNSLSKRNDRFNLSKPDGLTEVTGMSSDSELIDVAARSPKMSLEQRTDFYAADLVRQGKVATRQYARSTLDEFEPKGKTDLGNAFDLIDAYQERVGIPLSGTQRTTHNANLQQIRDEDINVDTLLDDKSDVKFTRQIKDISDDAPDSVESETDKPDAATSDKPEDFDPIQIYDMGRFTAEDFTPEGNLDPELFDDEEGQFYDLTDAQKEHLKEITFESGKDYKKAGTEGGAKLATMVDPRIGQKVQTIGEANKEFKEAKGAKNKQRVKNHWEGRIEEAAENEDAVEAEGKAEKAAAAQAKEDAKEATKKSPVISEDPGERVGAKPETKPVERKPAREEDLDPSARRIDTTREELEAEEQATEAAAKKPAAKKPAAKKPAEEKPAEDVAEEEDVAKLPQAEANSIMDVLDEHHNTTNAGKTTPEGTAFNALKEKLAPKLLRGELNQGDLKDISEHLANHSNDTSVVSASKSVSGAQMVAVLQAGKVAPPTEQDKDDEVGSEETEDDPELLYQTETGTGTSDKEVDAADKKADTAAAVDKGFESLFEQHKDKFQNMYDASGHDEDMFSFEDFKETEAAEYKKKGSAKYKQGFSAAHQTHKNKQASAQKQEKAAEVRDRKTAAKENAGEIQQRLADQGHKVSVAQAAQLHEQHDGDIDRAVESHSDEQKVQEAKKAKAEGDYPDDLSHAGIKQALFGDENPTGFLSDKLPERNENRHGVKATALYRDLVLHHEEHGYPATAAGKKKLTETLALLRRPEAAIKGFQRRPNEQFADYDHAEKQLNDLKEQGIDPRSPEGRKILSSQDRTLHESRQNYEDKHLKPSSNEHQEENKRIWDHGNPNHVAKFDEDGNQIGRQKYSHRQGVHEDDAGNDVHHSPIKEMHQTLSEGQQSSLDKLRRAHKVKEQISKTPLNDDQRKLIGQYNEAHEAREKIKDPSIKPSPGPDHPDHEALESAYGQHEEQMHKHTKKIQDLHVELQDAGVHGGGDTARGIAAIGEGGDVDKHIAQHTTKLEESGLKQNDFMHDEKDIPQTGPPDPESAKHMTGEGYQWHEDTRRWRHQETHDSAVRANGTQNGSLISGTHAPKGKYGYMASASVGSDGKINAVADSNNFAVTPTGTHRVESKLGGSPPTHPQGIQSHQLGTALSSAGVDHGGTSTTFPLSHLNNTGIQSSAHFDPPTSAGATLRGAATTVGRVGGAALQQTGLADSKIGTTVARAAKIGGGLVNQALGKEYGEMTSVELLQLHVALRKMEKGSIAV